MNVFFKWKNFDSRDRGLVNPFYLFVDAKWTTNELLAIRRSYELQRKETTDRFAVFAIGKRSIRPHANQMGDVLRNPYVML